MIEVVSNPASFHAAIPPFKYPNELSYPIRDNRVTTSSSRPSSATIIIGWLMSDTSAPTHRAKPPSIPKNIDPGICSLVKEV